MTKYEKEYRCKVCGAFKPWKETESTESMQGDAYSYCSNTKSYLHRIKKNN